MKDSSVAQSYLTLSDPTDCSMPGFPVHHQLLELTQTHVHWFSYAIRPSHPLSSPSPPVFYLFQFQGWSFPVSQFFSSGGQSIGASASASVLPMNIQDWFPLGWIGWISLQSKGLSRIFSTPQFKSINSLVSAFFITQLSHPYMTPGKTITFTRWTFVGKAMSLLFNMLSRLIIWVTSHHSINSRIWSKNEWRLTDRAQRNTRFLRRNTDKTIDGKLEEKKKIMRCTYQVV